MKVSQTFSHVLVLLTAFICGIAFVSTKILLLHFTSFEIQVYRFVPRYLFYILKDIKMLQLKKNFIMKF